MTRKVISASPDQTVEDALSLMLKNRVAHLPVLERGNLVGILSDRDLRTLISPKKHKSAKAKGKEPFSKKVRDVMTKSVITADAGMNIHDAAKMMLRLKIGCLPVIDNNKMEGIITKDDLLDVFVELLRTLQQSSSIYIELMDEIDDCSTVFSVLQKHKARVLSYSATPAGNGHRQICHFRLGRCPVKKITQDLAKKGVKVLEAFGEDL
ncbi:MAG: CBS domain-containing protein [Nitrospinae bacterium]|nr:CBS domain-containing protein [Nitrospinota bacterium]